MTVHLVGAGCGKPEWITCEALRTIKTAEHLVYDRLIHPDLLQLAPENCIFHYAGKRKDRHAMSQEEINSMLIELGSSSSSVVRLKGGDPFVFGRGGEEALALQKAGVPWSYIPGITAAIGGLGAAGIPLTHRGMAETATLATGHLKKGTEPDSSFWTRLSQAGGTRAIYMGASSSKKISEVLRKSGESPETPCASVTWGGWGRSSVDHFTLEEMADKEIISPSVIAVGDVASLNLCAENGPLKGLQIAIARPGPASWHTARYLEKLGADCYSLPLLQMEKLRSNWDGEAISSSDWLVLSSPRAVALLPEVIDLRHIGGRILSLGPGTTRELIKRGIRPDYEASEPTSEGVATTLRSLVYPKEKVCFFRNELASPLPVEAIKDIGAVPIVLSSYRMTEGDIQGEDLYRMCWEETGLDRIVFGSAALVKEWHRRFGDLPDKAQAVTWGVHCAEAVRDILKTKPVVMNTPDLEGLVKALISSIEQKGHL